MQLSKCINVLIIVVCVFYGFANNGVNSVELTKRESDYFSSSEENDEGLNKRELSRQGWQAINRRHRSDFEDTDLPESQLPETIGEDTIPIRRRRPVRKRKRRPVSSLRQSEIRPKHPERLNDQDHLPDDHWPGDALGEDELSIARIGHKRRRLNPIFNEDTEPERSTRRSDTENQEEFKLQTKSYRRPYSKNRDEDSEPKSAVDLKSILKQSDGSLSLVEILQQKNLSLSDILAGKQHALSALKETETDNPIRDEHNRLRRLPAVENREKVREEVSENTKHDRNEPRRRLPASSRLPHHHHHHHSKNDDSSSLRTHMNEQRKRLSSLHSDKGNKAFNDVTKFDVITEATTEKRIFVPSNPRKVSEVKETHKHEILDEPNIQSGNLRLSSTKHVFNFQSITPKTHIIPTEKVTTITFAPRRLPPEYVLSDESIEQSTQTTVSEEIEQIIYAEKPTTHRNIHYTSPRLETTFLPTIPPTTNPPLVITTTTTTEKIIPVIIIKENGNGITRNRLALKPKLRLPAIKKLPVTSHQLTTKLEEKKTTPKEPETTENYPKLPIVPNAFAINLKEVFGISEIIKDTTTVKNQEGPLKITMNIEDNITNKERQPEISITPRSFSVNSHIPIPVMTSSTHIPTSPSARDEIMELIKDSDHRDRLSRILALRNMTLAELVALRERGSSQVHLADIFHNQTKEPMPDDTKDVVINKVNHTHLETNRIIPLTGFSEIPSLRIPEPISITDPKKIQKDSDGSSYYTSIEKILPPRTDDLLREARKLQKLSITSDIPYRENIKVALKPLKSNAIWKSPILPENPYIDDYLSDQIELLSEYENVKPIDVKTSHILHDLRRVEDIENSISQAMNEELNVDISHKHLYEDDEDEYMQLPSGVKSAIIASAAIIGSSIIIFMTIFIACKWRQKRTRRLRRYSSSFSSNRIRSPILESQRKASMKDPVLVNPSTSSKTMSMKSEIDDQNMQDYLWDTLRKPFH